SVGGVVAGPVVGVVVAAAADAVVRPVAGVAAGPVVDVVVAVAADVAVRPAVGVAVGSALDRVSFGWAACQGPARRALEGVFLLFRAIDGVLVVGRIATVGLAGHQ